MYANGSWSCMDKLLLSDTLGITYAHTHTQVWMHTLTPTPCKSARGAVSISCEWGSSCNEAGNAYLMRRKQIYKHTHRAADQSLLPNTPTNTCTVCFLLTLTHTHTHNFRHSANIHSRTVSPSLSLTHTTHTHTHNRIHRSSDSIPQEGLQARFQQSVQRC